MVLNRKINYFFALLVIVIPIIGCSPSSSTQRYSQNKPKKEEQPKSVRFTSADSSKQKNTQQDKPELLVVEDLPNTIDAEFDEIPVEENPIDKSKFVANFDKLKTFNIVLTPREKILFEVIKFLETPYKYGGNSGIGIDCSAFTKQVFQSSLSVEIPRSASEQYRFGEKVSIDDLKFGDLIFFNTTKRSFPGHVGIYLGEDQFVHASRSLGVTVSSLENVYYKKRFVGGRRVENIASE